MTKLSIIRGSVSQLTGANKKDFSGNMIKVNILKQEVEHLKTLLQPTDTGHLHTTKWGWPLHNEYVGHEYRQYYLVYPNEIIQYYVSNI